jgi:DNA invertase Pin-like site-specific DNA recombinase
MCRVSTEEQALHGDSLEAQETALVEYANNNNMKIYKIYRDEGFSARKAVLKRPAMLELLEDVRADKLDMIIFTKLDRWFRNVKEYHRIQEILEKHRVTWKSILEDYNTATADGRLKVNIMLSVAENEADRTSERIKFVFQSKINKKEVIIPPQCVPYGYKIELIDGTKKLVKDEETKEIIEYFFKTALISSIRQAAIETNRKFGLNRAYGNWHKICNSSIYTGTYYGVDDYCEPYITEEQQQALINRVIITRKAKHNRTYLFSGLIRCSCCGNIMTGRYATGQNGTEYFYYRCNRVLVKGCPSKTMAEKKAEKYLLENITTELEKFILSVEATQSTQPKRKTGVEKLKEQLRRVNVSYQAGNMEDDEYLAKTKEIKAMIEKASAEDKPVSKVDVEKLKGFLNSGFQNIYNSLTDEEKQKMWRSIISEITYDGKEFVSIKFKA